MSGLAPGDRRGRPESLCAARVDRWRIHVRELVQERERAPDRVDLDVDSAIPRVGRDERLVAEDHRMCRPGHAGRTARAGEAGRSPDRSAGRMKAASASRCRRPSTRRPTRSRPAACRRWSGFHAGRGRRRRTGSSRGRIGQLRRRWHVDDVAKLRDWLLQDARRLVPERSAARVGQNPTSTPTSSGVDFQAGTSRTASRCCGGGRS